MIVNIPLILKQKSRYDEPESLIGLTLENPLKGYEKLLEFKATLPKELYAYWLRTLWKMNTNGLSPSLSLQLFSDVSPEDLMYEDELEAIKNFEDVITIYRGTDKTESVPLMSWSMRKDIASQSHFARGRLFVARIPKTKVIMYISHDGDEEEIVAYVESGFEIIDD